MNWISVREEYLQTRDERKPCAAQAHTASDVATNCSLAIMARPMTMIMATMPSIRSVLLGGLDVARPSLGAATFDAIQRVTGSPTRAFSGRSAFRARGSAPLWVHLTSRRPLDSANASDAPVRCRGLELVKAPE